ncbi:MAG: LacI family DNA-binding transcriptional regulator [Planctomycetota bacterium]|jgi:LacI family transcriptional regulator|nr:LacI family DNA-binding transcriptional regulator [Planctomycetota bacterium]
MTTTKATLDEIAQRAGVSIRTACRVLNGEGGKGARRDAVERAERIRAVAHELGYRPNQAARAMREGRFGTVGLVLSRGRSTSTVATGLLQGIHDQLALHDMHLAVARLSDDQLGDQQVLPGLLREQMLDGLLMGYSHNEPPALTELIARFRIPTIWLNNKRPEDCVHPDDYQGARRATEYLLGLGHRRIALWSHTTLASAHHYSVRDRRQGYVDVMKAARRRRLVWERDMRPHTHEQGGDDRIAHGRDWLNSEPRPTAILADNAGSATVAMMAALSLGLRVPHDLSILFVDQGLQDPAGLGLSRFWTDAANMGRRAVDELLAKIADPSEPRAPLAMPYELFRGCSCAPASP